MGKKSKTILGVALLIGFIIDAILVMSGSTVAFDQAIYDVMFKTDFITGIMKFITLAGEDLTIIAIALMSLVIINDKKKASFVPGSALAISIINSILKLIFKRPRPLRIALIVESGYSFPSGHSITAIVFYGFIAYLICRSTDNQAKKKYTIVVLSILILAIGISRIYLGVHYATDVIGGFLLGGAFLVAFTTFYENVFQNGTAKVATK